MSTPASPVSEDEMEAWIARALREAFGHATPPTLRAAMMHAVIPGGARVRPRLVLAVAGACGGPWDEDVMRAAASVELMHCASLVHDDMPCFDDAAIRRGRPTVHALYGEAMALLAGDGLIVAAMGVLARGPRSRLWIDELVKASGAAHGLVAGQAWELESDVPLTEYHQAKTGALFEAACAMGALASEGDVEAFRRLGRRIGAVYQLADDMLDAKESSVAGKPTGQDERHGRPSVVRTLGLEQASALLDRRFTRMVQAVPACPGAKELRGMLRRGLGPVLQHARATPGRGDRPSHAGAAVALDRLQAVERVA